MKLWDMKRVVWILSIIVLGGGACTSSNRAYNTSSARATYGVLPGPEVAPAARVKQKKVKKLKYSNGRGGTMSYSQFTRKRYPG
jgi:hypothetical protein